MPELSLARELLAVSSESEVASLAAALAPHPRWKPALQALVRQGVTVVNDPTASELGVHPGLRRAALIVVRRTNSPRSRAKKVAQLIRYVSGTLAHAHPKLATAGESQLKRAVLSGVRNALARPTGGSGEAADTQLFDEVTRRSQSSGRRLRRRRTATRRLAAKRRLKGRRYRRGLVASAGLPPFVRVQTASPVLDTLVVTGLRPATDHGHWLRRGADVVVVYDDAEGKERRKRFQNIHARVAIGHWLRHPEGAELVGV